MVESLGIPRIDPSLRFGNPEPPEASFGFLRAMDFSHASGRSLPEGSQRGREGSERFEGSAGGGGGLNVISLLYGLPYQTAPLECPPGG